MGARGTVHAQHGGTPAGSPYSRIAITSLLQFWESVSQLAKSARAVVASRRQRLLVPLGAPARAFLGPAHPTLGPHRCVCNNLSFPTTFLLRAAQERRRVATRPLCNGSDVTAGTKKWLNTEQWKLECPVDAKLSPRRRGLRLGLEVFTTGPDFTFQGLCPARCGPTPIVIYRHE